MRLLLDTNALIWWLANLPRLGRSARHVISTAEQVFVSAVTGYEISFKCSLGKLSVPENIDEQVDKHGFEPLPLTLRHAMRAGELPLHHRDPFDRLLLAQVVCDGLTLVTSDRALEAYRVPIVRADA